MADKPKLGMLGVGMVRRAGEALVKSKKKKKSRLDEIMGGIQKSRKTR